jgi:small subunit ribosomal protein S5
MKTQKNKSSAKGLQKPQEFDQKVLDIARVARVVAGGRRFNFRAAVVIGDRKGRVGLGIGKGRDVSIAVNKAVSQAKKNVIRAPITKYGTIPYEAAGKQTSSRVLLFPGKTGRGIVAGGAVRAVCELAGYKDITAKIMSRSTNRLNNATAAIKALQSIKSSSVKSQNEN